jgi:hypothetical protein
MRKIATIIILVISVFSACKNEQKVKTEMKLGDFALSKDKLMAGDTIAITYTGTSTEVEALYYFMVNDKAFPADINLSKENKASIIIPDSAQAIAFNFKMDGKYDDNNKNGYLIALQNIDGEEIAGSKAALALYSMYYGERYGVAIKRDSVFNDIKVDMDKNHQIKEFFAPMYYNQLYKKDKVASEKQITSYIVSVTQKNNLTERDYENLNWLYNIIDKKALADSISKIAMDKFPNGKMAKNSYDEKFYNEKDLDKKEAIFNEYSNRYKKSGDVGDYMVQSLANIYYYEKKDANRFEKYANKISSKLARAEIYNGIAWPLVEKGEDLDFAEKISKQSVELMQSLKEKPEDKPDYFSENQYLENIKGLYSMFADTYAFILFKQGKLKEAISYQEKLTTLKGKMRRLTKDILAI